MRNFKLAFLILVFCLQIIFFIKSATAEAPYIPEQLDPWIEWVSHKHSELRCASIDGSSACMWPGKIDLDVSGSGAHFRIVVHVDDESSLILPGTDSAQAHNVEIKSLSANGSGYLEPTDAPSVQLNRGDYEISGNLSWAELPETLNLPGQVGLVRLVRDGKLIDRPHLEGSTIWLGGVGDKPVREADALSINSVRFVSDGAPFVIATALYLRVAGTARELILPDFLPDGFVVTAIDTSLPYQITQQGLVSLQLSAGEHTVTITAQSANAPASFTFPTVKLEEWPAQEYLSWRPDPSFRSVAVSGGVLTDASRTELPAEWRQGSIYALKPGEAFTLSEQARGEQEPQTTQISLQRNIWLHANGSGFTGSDLVRGFAAAPWRLDLNADLKLGQASIDGVPQVITRNPVGDLFGVELRSANLNLSTTFLSDQYSHIPANGWTRQVESSQVNVHLPAGWRVLAALGADSASNTILAGWSLIDFLTIALLAALSAMLFGFYGGVAMAALALAFHGGTCELNATWIGLIAGCLGMKYLPAGRLRVLARIYTALIVLCLAFLLPSIVSQLSEIFVPSAGSGVIHLRLSPVAQVAYALLERTPHFLVIAALLPWLVTVLYTAKSSRRLKILLTAGGIAIIFIVLFVISSLSTTFYRVDSIAGDGEVVASKMQPIPAAPASRAYDRANQAYDSGMQQAVRERDEQSNEMLELRDRKKESVLGADRLAAGSGAGYIAKPQVAFQEIDPRAVVQTGPGVPQTNGPTVELRWNNKVASDQSARLFYLSPFMSSLLTLLGVCSIVLLWFKAFKRVRQAAWVSAIMFMLVTNSARAQTFPSSELLNDLQQRLLSARCSQDCVAIDSVKIRLEAERATISMRVSSQGVGAVALPGPLSELVVSDVKVGASQAAALLRSENDVLYTRVPDGASQIEMSAVFVDANEAALTFSQQPHFVSVEASGWQVDGLSAEGRVRGNLHFARSGSGSSQQQIDGAKRSGAKLPQWYTLDRSMRIGLNWLTTTTVTRSSGNSEAAASVQVPLLSGESILTAGLKVADGKVEIPFGYGQSSYSFESKLTPGENLLLKATALPNTTEVWSVTCSTIWQCKAAGLNPIYSQAGDAQAWRWRPFPGEEVRLNFAKPLGAEGQTTTIDSVVYELVPDARSTAITIRAAVRESQSGLFSIQIPAELVAEKVLVSGAPQVLRREGDRMLLNLPAGPSQIEVRASVASGWETLLHTPTIRLGESAVNLSTKISPSSSRWNLFAGGAGSGPVMLWWGKLALLVLFIIILVHSFHIELSPVQAAVLMFGFAVLPVETALLPFFLLALLAWRSRARIDRRWVMIAVQIGAVLLGLLSLWAIWSCLSIGLSRAPNMLIASSNSAAAELIWTLQRADGSPPSAWLLSVPVAVWQLVFVAWLGLSAAIIYKKRAWVASCVRALNASGKA